ncbi:MAG: glycosyltransferase [Chitinispirillaceae bacterium]|jgi:1,2-diacylglycerol-3-alpha-glucose alpha-1,2-galactosyltransferase
MADLRLRIHVISETAYIMKGQGVHTAFLDCIAILKAGDDVECIVNQEGWGDILHAHSYGPYFFLKGLRRRYRGRKILTVHVIPDSIRGSLPAWRLLMPFVRWYFRLVYSFADYLIAISPMVEEAIRSLKVTTPIIRINNPINAATYRPAAKKREAGRQLLNTAGDAVVVLGVGQIEPRKGVEDFLDIAGKLPQLSFIWVGGRPFGPLTEGVTGLDRKIASAMAVNPQLKFAGTFPLEQMPLIYNAADLLLFPSLQENSPMVPIEAAAAGLPVIFRDLPEYKKLYLNSYLSANSTDSFAELIRKIQNDRKFRGQALTMSEKLIGQFDKIEIRRQLLSLYREVLEEHPLQQPRRVLKRNYPRLIQRTISRTRKFIGKFLKMIPASARYRRNPLRK